MQEVALSQERRTAATRTICAMRADRLLRRACASPARSLSRSPAVYALAGRRISRISTVPATGVKKGLPFLTPTVP